MFPASAKRLRDFVESGGKVIFLGKTPKQAAGFAHHEEDSSEVLELISAMRTDNPDRTPIVSVNETGMTSWYRDLQLRHALEPDVHISNPTDYISQMRYRNGEQDIFFFTHYGPEDALKLQATFKVGDKEAWLWDPETGQRTRFATGQNEKVIPISLGPSELKLIVFEPRGFRTASTPEATRSATEEDIPDLNRLAIRGPWTVRLASVDGSNLSVELPELIDLRKRGHLGAFAGDITYQTNLEINETRLPRWLSLGRVHAISELEINGEPLGVRWYGEHQYDVRGKLHTGQNQISIKIVTTLGKYMKSLKDNPTAIARAVRTPDYPIGLLGPEEMRF